VRTFFRKIDYKNGLGSDRAAAVRKAYHAPTIGRSEERASTGVFEAFLQTQRGGSMVFPVVALLVSKGAATPQQQKLVREGRLELIFKCEHTRRPMLAAQPEVLFM